jgi:hypothetical protein
MGRIKKHLPVAALAVAAISLFVALGTTAIGAGGGGSTKSTPASLASTRGLAHVSVLHSVTTGTFSGPARTVAPGQQLTNVTATCPPRSRVMGGGVFSDSSDVGASINTSEPISSRTWRIDYNNGTQSTIQVRAIARCIRFS